MKLALIRSGGVAGMKRRAMVETTPGTPQDEEFRNLVRNAQLEHFPEPTIRTYPDRLLYTLTVEDGEIRHSVLFDEERTPEHFRPLMEAILRDARKDDDPESKRA